MLVLSRKIDETVTIGGDIAVRIVRVRGDRVMLGIDAPDDMLILRGEVFEQMVAAGAKIPSREAEAPA